MASQLSEAHLRQAVAFLSDTYGPPPPRQLAVLDHALFALVWEGGPAARAFAAYKQLVNAFCNRNEMRVSHAGEIAAQLEEIPGAEAKAERLLDVLQYVFETTYAFDLESMRAKPARHARKQLSKITGMTPFATDAATLRALNAFTLPLDAPALALGRQLGLFPADATPAELAAACVELLTTEEAEILCVGLGELAADPRQAELVERLAAKPAKKAAPGPKPAAPAKKKAPAKKAPAKARG